MIPFADFDLTQVDVALRFGAPGWSGLHHELLKQEEIITVAAPSLIGERPLPMSAQDILNLPLLHDAFNVGWERWAKQHGNQRRPGRRRGN